MMVRILYRPDGESRWLEHPQGTMHVTDAVRLIYNDAAQWNGTIHWAEDGWFAQGRGGAPSYRISRTDAVE